MPLGKTDALARRLYLVLLTALFGIVVLRSAWMHDDAYITFRTVDNYINGYGLRWNVVERVQTYTHPLWMFVVAACYAVTHEMYFTVIALSVALSVGTAFLILSTAQTLGAGSFGIAILGFSKAFVDYSTSGLENPLTHCLYASFLVVLLAGEMSVATLHTLATLAALATLNRMDTALLFLPALAFVWWRVDRPAGLAVIAAGFLPFAVWEAFSLFYYGFPFPNTAYAKLFETGISQSDRLIQGLHYFQNAARTDTVTLLAIGGGVAMGLAAADRRQSAVGVGIAAYLGYVLWIGGDFVSGRFLTAPLLGAVALLTRWRTRSAYVMALTAVVIAVALRSGDPPPLRTDATAPRAAIMDAHGVADERVYYYPYTGFLRALEGVRVADHPWSREGLEARARDLRLTFRGDIGFFGFSAGPRVHVVDVWGLADPLIARQPARRDVGWRIGHFARAIPRGYAETLATGRNQIVDPEIAAQYERLALVTRGPLLSSRRLVEIWKMNVWSR